MNIFDATKVKEELIEWIRDYFKENGSPKTKAVVGISGGKDSSVVAALCKEALGKDRVFGVLMPQGVQDDIDVANEICKVLDIPRVEVNIQGSVKSLYDEVENTGLELNNIVTFNTPARIRMAVLYAISGIVSGRVANTCNLSENWVGYATKFGDAAGDFSPLAELTVSEVKAIGRELGLAPKFIDKVPADGLCGMTDEDNFGFSYVVLDRYIRENVCEDVSVKDRIDKMHSLSLHKLNPIPEYSIKR